MTFGEIKELHEMGFTAEQIMALTAGQSQPADNVPEPDGVSQPAGNGDHQTPAEDQNPEPEPTEPNPDSAKIASLEDQLKHTQKQLTELTRQMQKNNLRTASVNLMPDDDLEKKTDAAMAELIRPSIEGRD